jgi:hypothetical protein
MHCQPVQCVAKPVASNTDIDSISRGVCHAPGPLVTVRAPSDIYVQATGQGTRWSRYARMKRRVPKLLTYTEGHVLAALLT